MLNIKPPNYKFCPFCGKEMATVRLKGKTYKKCGADNWIYFPRVTQSGCAAVLKNNKILLVKRLREPYMNKWMLPSGFVNYGEHPSETVVREVEEETGLIAKNPKLMTFLQSLDDPRELGHLVFFYKVDVQGKVKNGDTDENSDIKWFDLLGELPPIAWKDHKTVIKKLQTELREAKV